jgi:phosphoglycolate phosphatase
MFQLYVFDLDGTLIDSRRDLAESMNLLLEAAGARPLPEEAIGRMVGDGAAMLVARAFAAVGRPQPPDALQRFLEIYDTRLIRHTRPYPEIPRVLHALGGAASLAVLTNKPLASTRAVLEGLDLARYFDADAIVGGDGPFPRKPDPAGLWHLVARAHADVATTVMVGDSVIDLNVARSAGCAVCLARYGFGFETLPPDLITSRDRTIDVPGELLRL